MEKTSKKTVALRYFGEARREKESPRFPLPPFVAHEQDLLPLQSFFRATLGTPRHVVVVAQGDILTTLEAFSCLPPSGEARDKRVFLCASGDSFILERIGYEFPQEGTVFLFLARRPEELWGLLAFFALQDRKKVLVGEPHGAFAECARECFVPFLPVEIPCFSFWHRSAFLYLPLMLSGFSPEEMDKGFRKGYVALHEAALRAALLISQELAEKTRVYIVTGTLFMRKVTAAFLPLLELCFGKGKCFRTVSSEDLWQEKEELSHSLVIFLQENAGKAPPLKIPQVFFSPSGLFAERAFLRRSSCAEVRAAGMEVLQSLLRSMRERFLLIELPDHSLFSLGQYLAFLQCLACYGAWLQGVDVFSDPPLVQFEHAALSVLAKHHGEEFL